MSFAEQSDAGAKGRIRPESFSDHYSQARQFYRSQTPSEQGHIRGALVFELSKLTKAHVREAVLGHLVNIDKELAARVAAALGLESVPTGATPAVRTVNQPESPSLSIHKNMRETLEGRAVGILFAEGSKASTVKALKKAAEKAGATVKLIAPRIGPVGGTGLEADVQLAGTPSVLVDAIAVILSDDGAKALRAEAAAIDFVRDAFGHLKAIGVDGGGSVLLDAAGIERDEGVIDAADADAFVTAAQRRFWQREKLVRSIP